MSNKNKCFNPFVGIRLSQSFRDFFSEKTFRTKLLLPAIFLLSFCTAVNAQWTQRSSDLPAQRGIIEMSTYGVSHCYATTYDASNFGNLQHVLTITHDGGLTWHSQTIDSLENNFLIDVVATNGKVVHVLGWNFVQGGGNMFKSKDGGQTWEREGKNAFTNPASFPDDIVFFNQTDGVVLGDPVNGAFEIYTTHDKGKHWNQVAPANIPAPLPNEYGTGYAMEYIGNTVWTITTVFHEDGSLSARLMQSDDQGETWYIKNSSLTFETGDLSMRFRDQSTGLYKNNGKLYRTTDGGTTYTQVNYSGTFFSFDFDNVPNDPGTWLSTGGDVNLSSNSMNGIGSSVSYDDGDSWITLDTGVDHTCIEMVGKHRGYTGGITTAYGHHGVFIYSGNALKEPDELAAACDQLAFNVYPNPSSEHFSLDVTSVNEADCNLRVYDMQGRLVINQKFTPNEIFYFGKDLTPGLYFSQIISGREKHSLRLIKQ